MANPNVLTATSIYGKCVVQTISTAGSAQIVNVIENLSGSGKLIKVTNSSASIESGLRESFQTKIESRGAMISTNYVKESVEEIYDLINQ